MTNIPLHLEEVQIRIDEILKQVIEFDAITDRMLSSAAGLEYSTIWYLETSCTYSAIDRNDMV